MFPGRNHQFPADFFLKLPTCLPFPAYFLLRSSQRKHLFSVMPEIIAVTIPPPLVGTLQFPKILLRYPESFFSRSQINIHIFPVHPRNSRHIFRLFHASLNLKRMNAASDQIRYSLYGTEIFQAQDIPCLLPACRIRKPAGLGALPPVPAASSDHAAEQTLAGIAVTERSMYKAFHLKPRMAADFLHLRQGKLSGRDNPRHTQRLQILCRNHICYRHLGTCMDEKSRKLLHHIVHHTQILNNDRIQSLLV